MKSSRKERFKPPPLDLNAHTLEADPSSPHHSEARVPKSPGDLPRECLPIRKRHLVESGRNSAFHSKSPKSAGPGDIFPLRLSTPTSISAAVDLSSTNGSHTAPNSPIVTAFGPLNSSLSLTPSSATSANNQTFTHFPVPPPLIPVPPGSGNAVAAVAMAAMANAFNSSKSKAASVASSSSGFPTPPTDVHSPYAWAHSPAALAAVAAGSPFSPLPPLSPFPTVTSLLSPTASHPSSVSSSREDLASMEREILKRRILPPPPAVGTYDTPASPLWSFGGAPMPSPVWQCFQIGTRIKFLLANTDAPWQKAEELAWKDHVAMKIDSRNSYQYAPNGLVLVQVSDLTEKYFLRSTIFHVSCFFNSIG